MEPVKLFAEAVKREGIALRLSPAWLVSKEDNNPYNIRTREILSEFEYLKISVGDGNVIFPSGNAKKYLSEYFDENAEYVNPYEENPKDVRAISFEFNGDVLQGNVNRQCIMKILEEYTC